LRGQVVNAVTVEAGGVVRVHCYRDARYRPIDTWTGQRRRGNRWLRRMVCDVPMFGHRVALDIEYLEIGIGARERRVESPFIGHDMGTSLIRFRRLASSRGLRG